MIPARWLPRLPPPPANGWLPVYYEVSEDSGILRQGEYRFGGARVWARNAAVSVGFLPREKYLDDVVVARRMLHLLEHRFNQHVEDGGNKGTDHEETVGIVGCGRSARFERYRVGPEPDSND